MSTIQEWTAVTCLNDKRQYLGGFVSKCRAIKSLDFDLMKNAESRPQRPLNAGTSSRSTSSNNFKFGDPRGQRNSSSTRDKAGLTHLSLLCVAIYSFIGSQATPWT